MWKTSCVCFSIILFIVGSIPTNFYIIDTAYVILIVNACVTNPKMLNSLPKYIFRHFAYFKSKYPDCIPDLRVRDREKIQTVK